MGTPSRLSRRILRYPSFVGTGDCTWLRARPLTTGRLMSFNAVIWALGLDTPLGPKERLVLIYLADFCNEGKGYAWPSISRLARSTGLSVSSVKRAISALVTTGLVATATQSRAVNGHRFTNRYYLACFGQKPSRRNFSVQGDFNQRGEWDESADSTFR